MGLNEEGVMPQIEVTLSIGFSGEVREDVLDISDDEWAACETDNQRNDLLYVYWETWSSNYINGGYKLIDEESK